MGIYIKGMKPPKDCRECLQGFVFQIECDRMKDGKISYYNRRKDCPLIEVKTPHGRLVDESEIHTGIRMENNTEHRYFIDKVNAPTVIEAEVK